MFRRIALSALGAAIITGVLVTLVELFAVVPLIQKAELYEEGALNKSALVTPKVGNPAPQAGRTGADGHGDHDHGASGEDRRGLYTAIATFLTAIGYGFLLGALFSRMKSVGWKSGVALGVAGFAVFQLAPAIGLPPAPPGMAEADVILRQIWWVGTVIATGLGLAACYFAFAQKKHLWALAGVLLIVVPHLIGAPRPVEGENLVPDELVRNFAIVALLTAAVFWLVLGGVQGYLFGKLNEWQALG